MRYRFLIILALYAMPALAQSAFTEGSVVYDINVAATGKEQAKQAMDGAVQTLYVKGFQARMDFESAVGFSTIIMDQRNKHYVLLRGAGDSKFMTKMDESQWLAFNKKYANLVWEKTGRDSIIQGYKVSQAMTTLKDGGRVNAWFTADLQPLAKQYDMMMREMEGLPLYYTMQYPEMTLIYKVRQINFSPVMNTRFSVPQSGYKVLEPKEQ